MTAPLLILNVGSSSVKYRIFASDTLAELSGGKVTDIVAHQGITHEQAIESILAEHGTNFSGAAHRVVHGGADFTTTTRVTPDVVAKLEKLTPYAPLHQPHNIAAIKIIFRLCPSMPQFACFDTAFHHGHDPLYDCYALPAALRDKGLRRYGFHGLSYQWIAQQLQKDYPHYFAGRVVVAHLGNGASLCALRQGKSIDSTMGLTALDGIPMGTRSGNVDPGLILTLIKDQNMSASDVEDILYNQSGLLGLSGLSNDVKTLTGSNDPRSAFALKFFALKIAQAIATLGVSLGGIDAIVFTGGIGENAVGVRDAVLQHLTHLGPIPHLVIKTNEEWIMAHDVQGLL